MKQQNLTINAEILFHEYMQNNYTSSKGQILVLPILLKKNRMFIETVSNF